MDKLDIRPGQLWERKVEEALTDSPHMLVILSPSSVNSSNVMAEVAFAIEEGKEVIPVLFRDCKIPFRLRPFQHVDSRGDYSEALDVLLNSVGVERPPEQGAAKPPTQSEHEEFRGARDWVLPTPNWTAAEQARLAEKERARQAQEHRDTAEKTEFQREEKERQAAAEQARLAVEERIRQEPERRDAAEKARLEEQEQERQLAAVEARRLEQEKEQQATAEQARRAEAERAQQEQVQKQAAEKAKLEQERGVQQAATREASDWERVQFAIAVVFGLVIIFVVLLLFRRW